MIALILGGPLAKACTWCEVPPHVECRSSGGMAVKPHGARVKAAPPIVEAHVGDLVIVRHRGEHVAQLVDIGDPGRAALTVRFWRPSAQVFASPRLLEREAVIGLAPEDARTDLARAELRLEGERRALIGAPCDIEIEGRRAAGFVTKLDEHGQPAEVEMFTVAPDIAEGRGPFDPVISHITPDEIRRLDAFGHITSDPSPTTPDAPPDPWFTPDSAETTAPPKGW